MLCNPFSTRYFRFMLASSNIIAHPNGSNLGIHLFLFLPLGVLEPPTIQEMPEVVQVTCGDPLSLECRVAGTPHISVRWTKDGKELLSSRKHNPYENNLSSLNIQSSQLGDMGEYLFEATNSVGTCSCKVMLVRFVKYSC